MRHRGSGFRSAMALLTRVPSGEAVTPHPAAVAWFPVVGALVGMAAAGVYALAAVVLPALLGAIAAVAAGLLITGAFHEDGLADYADAHGADSKERALEAMRDPRVGAFGAVALVVVIVWRVAAISTLPPMEAAAGLVMAHSMGRTAAVAMIGTLPAARPEGLGHWADAAPWWSRGAALLGGLTITTLVGGVWAVPAAAVAGVSVLWLRRSAANRLGGLTGDVLGACEQVTESLLLGLAVVAANSTEPAWVGLL